MAANGTTPETIGVLQRFNITNNISVEAEEEIASSLKTYERYHPKRQ